MYTFIYALIMLLQVAIILHFPLKADTSLGSYIAEGWFGTHYIQENIVGAIYLQRDTIWVMILSG